MLLHTYTSHTMLRHLTGHSALVAAAVAFTGLVSCNDDPGTVGSSYLPENVTFHTYILRSDEFAVTSGVSAASNSSAEGVTQVLAGEASDGTVAYGLVAFTNVPGVLDDGINRPVTQASFTLRGADYLYGDTTSRRVALELVVLDDVFTVNAKYSDELASKIRAARVLGAVDTTYTDTGSVVIPLDPTAAADFLRSYYRWDTISVTNGIVDRQFITLKTLAIRPRAGSQTVASFLGVTGVADSLRPTMNVVLGDTSAPLRCNATNWIAKNDVQTGDGRFVLGGGIAARTLLSFTLDSIPTGAVIHRAELRIHPVEDGSRLGTLPEPSTLVAYLAGDTSFSSAGYLTSSIGYLVMNRLFDSSGDRALYRITTLGPVLTRWLRTAVGRDNLPNRGLIVSFNRPAFDRATEYATVDRMTFHGPTAVDPTLRPSLSVTYSVQTHANH